MFSRILFVLLVVTLTRASATLSCSECNGDTCRKNQLNTATCIVINNSCNVKWSNGELVEKGCSNTEDNVEYTDMGERLMCKKERSELVEKGCSNTEDNVEYTDMG